MRFQTLSGSLGSQKADFHIYTVKNNDAATISKGAPCILQMTGTDDGVLVCLPSTLPKGVSTLLYGVALSDIAAAAIGEIQGYGFNRSTLLMRNTRAATTDSWASVSSFDIGLVLYAVSLNAFSASASIGSALSQAYAVLAETLASLASSASATSDTRTAISVSCKSFLRIG